MKFNKKNHHITTKKIFLSVAYLYSLSICSIENTYENAQSTGLSLTQSPTSNFYKLDQKLLLFFCFCFFFHFPSQSICRLNIKELRRFFWIFFYILIFIFFYYYSRGARDSKIGKKWPESSRILDYILC